MIRSRAAGKNTFASHIPHLLLVAGPSGAGKTTFVRQLCAGSLPGELRTLLPVTARDWDRIEGNRFVKRRTRPLLSPASVQAHRGLIVHYDIVHIHRASIEAYSDDPVFDLMRAAHGLSVVNLRPLPTQLIAQFSAREQALYKQKGRLRGAWKSAVLHPVRRLSLRLRGHELPDKHTLYSEPGWLEECYAQWDRFVATLQPRSCIVSVEPVCDVDGRPSFRLTRKS